MDTYRPEMESEINQDLFPIPEESVEGWKEKPIRGVKQELVPLGAFTDFSACDTSAVYFGERGGGPEMNFSGQVLNFVGQKVNRKESFLTHFVRKDVFDRLKEAQKLLPRGHYFKFFDGYRSLAVQQELFANQRKIIASQHSTWTTEQIDEETHKFIARPATDEESRANRPAPHTTGAAIDLRLIRMNEKGQALLQELEEKKQAGKLNYEIKPEEQDAYQQALAWINNQKLPDDKKQNWLSEYRYGIYKALIFRNFSETVDMGTGFDDFGKEAQTNYYETIPQDQISPDDLKRRNNRRLLYKIMNSVGFLNYPGEWWHFSYGDQEWAANKKQNAALFGEVGLSETNQAMEKARRLAYLKTIRDVRKGDDPIFIENPDRQI